MSETEFFGGEDEDEGGDITGLAVATVTDNEDSEKLGRVKLEFPFRDADDESYWARVATEMASKDYGTWFLPEVGDEVLVGFENGDIRHPFVIGSLYTGKKKPPYDNGNGDNNHRAIKSRSGHLIDLSDEDGSEKITIESQSENLSIVMNDESGSEKITIDDGSNTIEMDKSGGKVSISGQQEVDISAPTVKISAKSEVKISSKAKVKMSAKAQVNVSSKGQLKLESSGIGQLKASGPLTIKGAIIQLN